MDLILQGVVIIMCLIMLVIVLDSIFENRLNNFIEAMRGLHSTTQNYVNEDITDQMLESMEGNATMLADPSETVALIEEGVFQLKVSVDRDTHSVSTDTTGLAKLMIYLIKMWLFSWMRGRRGNK